MKKKPTLAAGERLEVGIERAVYRGLGLARHEGQVIFVPRGLPGERLFVRVVAVERGYARAVTEARRSAGPGARAAPCAAFPSCGGCAYQSLEYEGQLTLKAEMLRESLARAGVAWTGEIPMAGSPEEAWRTRASFHVAVVQGRLVLGLFEEGSRRIVDLPEGCPQVSPGMNRVLLAAREVMSARPGPASRVDHIHLVESPDGQETVLFLEGELDSAEAAALGGALSSPPITGLGAVIGPKAARATILLAGNPYVHTHVLGVRLRAHARGFFQGNRFLVETLATGVRDLLPEGGRVLDLYAGVGLFGLTAAHGASEVLMVEGNELSVRDAEENVRRHAARGVKVLGGDVGDVLARLPGGAGERIILDPPRAGLSRRVVEAVGRRKPSVVVYVSCDPATLARDLRGFRDFGLDVDSIQALDLFPDTFHVEAIARLVPR